MKWIKMEPIIQSEASQKGEMPNNAARLQHYENRKFQIYMLGLDRKRDTDV